MDHDRVNISTSVMSCGVRELSRISAETEGVVYALGTNLYHPGRGDPCAFYVWSDVAVEGDTTSSDALSQYIQDNLLGYVERSIVADNPRTGNPIVVFTCCINHDKWKAWYAERRKERYGKVGC